jgi:MutS domain V
MVTLKDAHTRALTMLDTSKVTEDHILETIFDGVHTHETEVTVTEQLWEDSGLETFVKNATAMKGAGYCMWKHMKQLTTNQDTLLQRQAPKLPQDAPAVMQLLATCEKDVLWMFTLPHMSKAWPINMLFPSAPVLRLLNNFPYLLEAFHVYRCYISPCMNIVTPITTIFAPWMYVRRSFNWMVSFKTYCNLLYAALKAGFKVTGNLRADLFRVVSILIYVVLMIYVIVQAFETATMLRKIRRDLKQKLHSVRTFITSAQTLIATTPESVFASWGIDKNALRNIHIPYGLSGLYKIIHCDTMKKDVLELVKAVYVLDMACVVKNLVNSGDCTKVTFGSTTMMWNMGHVLLDKKQVRNPVALRKNLIITGPNAAGKTTYVKSMFTNIILAQSLGIACASRAIICPVHTIGTFIRVSDILGKSSLFEAEAQRCAEIIRNAREISDRKQHGVYFLDEPMHSTPPLEGMSTCKAVLSYLSQLSGIRTITTTHHHEVTTLEKEFPAHFANLSMSATTVSESDGSYIKFIFPYTIRAGSSKQCIALELLRDHQLPHEVIQCAIKHKNKLYQKDVNDNQSA